MSSSLQPEYAKLISAFDDYFETDFDNEHEDTAANARLRSRLRDFVIDALVAGEATLAEQAIVFLLENTGCREDMEIYRDIRTTWLNSNLISESTLQTIERVTGKPIDRWN
jgi:hypothetical protein